MSEVKPSKEEQWRVNNFHGYVNPQTIPKI
jgi:hypothetical protein